MKKCLVKTTRKKKRIKEKKKNKRKRVQSSPSYPNNLRHIHHHRLFTHSSIHAHAFAKTQPMSQQTPRAIHDLNSQNPVKSNQTAREKELIPRPPTKELSKPFPLRERHLSLITLPPMKLKPRTRIPIPIPALPLFKSACRPTRTPQPHILCIRSCEDRLDVRV
jgi:hypothetical protein